MEHEFEYDDVKVVMRSPTVGDRITRRLIIDKLRRAFNVDASQSLASISDEFAESIVEYADMLSMTTSPGSAWWQAPGASPDDLRAGYECYMSMDASLFDFLSSGESSVKPEKKMMPNGSKK